MFTRDMEPMVGRLGAVGRFRTKQIAQQKTWAVIPDEFTTIAAMHIVHVVPSNGSTETQVNPVDPGDGFHLIIPTSDAPVIPAMRGRF